MTPTERKKFEFSNSILLYTECACVGFFARLVR